MTKVTATKGSDAPFSIGLGKSAKGGKVSCGKITIGGKEYWTGVEWGTDVTDPDKALAVSPFIYEPSK